MSRETREGWIGSVAIHALLAVVFVLFSVPEIIATPDLIELSWGAAVAPETPTETVRESSSPSSEGHSAELVQPRATQNPAQPVVLPERRVPDPSDDVLPTPRVEKLDVPQTGAPQTRAQTGGVGERERQLGKGVGEREEFTTNPAQGTSPSDVAAPASGSLGGDVDRGVAFSIQWMGGGTRKRVSGDLPEYPKGANVEAQIKILAVVQPDGGIKTVQPVQKANTKLEDAAMRAVRLWKFESLRQSQEQLDQNCVITFLFKLK